MRRLTTAACTLVLFLAAAAPARADALIERYTRSGGIAGMGAFEGTSVRGEAPPKDVEELMKGLGKLFGGGPKPRSEERGRRTGDGGEPLFTFYSEVRSVRTVPPDPSRFAVPAGYTKR